MEKYKDSIKVIANRKLKSADAICTNALLLMTWQLARILAVRKVELWKK